MARPRVPTNFRGIKQAPSKVNLDLWDAAHNGDIECLKIALKNGGNPDFYQTAEEGGPTSLHASARAPNADPKCTKELINKGADVNVILISNFNSPLHEAASSGNFEICKLLVEAGATVNAESGNGFGNTPLHTASRGGYLEIVKYLVEKGANVDAMNNRGSTSLHFCSFLSVSASKQNEIGMTGDEGIPDIYTTIASVLVVKGVDVDKADLNGYTALHVAAQRGCLSMVKLLLESGASLKCKTSIDDKGRGGRTPSQMAKFGEQHEVYKFLSNVEST